MLKYFLVVIKIILDRDEFEFNRIDYGYSDKLVAIIENELQILLNRIDNHILSFVQML